MSVAATQKKTRQRRSFSEICITHRADNTATCWHSISSVLRVSDLTTDIHHDTFCNQRLEMARLYFLKIMSSNNKKTILDEKKCVGRKKWENGRNNDTQLVLVLAFHLYHHPRHNSQHHYGSGRPAAHSPAQNFLLGPTLGNSQPLPRTTHLPTTCVQRSNLPTSFFLPTPEITECSSAFLLEHCSGPKCPFQKTLSPQSFTWKLEFCTSVGRPHNQTSLHLETGSHGTCDALQNIFVTSAWFLPSTCSSKPLKKTLPKFLFIIATFSLIIHNLIVEMSSNHAFHDNSPSQELPSAWNWEWWTFPRTHLIDITIRNFENLSIYPDICIRQHEEWNFDRSKSSRDDNLAWCTIWRIGREEDPDWKINKKRKNSPHTTFENEKMILEIGMGSKSSQSGKNINFIAGITVDLHERHPPALSKTGGKRLRSDHKNWELILANLFCECHTFSNNTRLCKFHVFHFTDRL